ncbi:helix-turn-helix domain-containing protein [Halomarina halobia]|uniref:Helix-turn-helix domain-containing protein n=1 Tax=Halomarina halobia TaxID=3033386 RepID=A0ABD6A6Z9_9EURY|nr:helix-turn-helix domain-containing protein [Halomarina sp. PSR21]
MSGTIAEIGVPTDKFALHETLKRHEGVTFEIERVVAYDAGRVMPYLWSSGMDGEALTTALGSDSSVETVSLFSDVDGEQLFQVEWAGWVRTLVRQFVEEEATILAATASHDGWQFRVLFPNREALSRTHDACGGKDMDLKYLKVHQMNAERPGTLGLTTAQHETLGAALRHGYYKVPRGVTTAELADELGISHQALSERLRRAHEALVEHALMSERAFDGETVEREAE